MMTKTTLLNSFRKFLAHPGAESVLLPLVKGKCVSHFFSRWIPMPHLYPSGSSREVVRQDLKLKLDISDMVDWHIYFEFQDPGYNFLFKQVSPSDTVFDIGANIGYVSLRLAKLASQGRVLGFEPSSYNFAKCKQNLHLNNLSNVEVLNMGLGRKPGVLTLVTDTIHNHGMNHIATTTSTGGDGETVRVSTLDEIAETQKLTQLNLIKLDVEGYELEILKGGESTLKKFKPKLFIEVDEQFLGRFGNSSAELFNWLRNLDYELFDINGERISNPDTLRTRHQDVLARIP